MYISKIIDKINDDPVNDGKLFVSQNPFDPKEPLPIVRLFKQVQETAREVHASFVREVRVTAQALSKDVHKLFASSRREVLVAA